MVTPAFQDLIPDNRCFGCGPDNPDGLRIKSRWAGEEAVCVFQPRPAHCAGPPQFLNGGIIATLIDCHSVCTAIAAAYRAEDREIGTAPWIWCVTAGLNISYLRPTPIESPVELRARIHRQEGKQTVVRCGLFSAGRECAKGEVVAVRVSTAWKNGTHISP